jgi:hypothetical protein
MDCHAGEWALTHVSNAEQSTRGVMAGLVPAIHDFNAATKDVDARHKAGHDEVG